MSPNAAFRAQPSFICVCSPQKQFKLQARVCDMSSWFCWIEGLPALQALWQKTMSNKIIPNRLNKPAELVRESMDVAGGLVAMASDCTSASPTPSSAPREQSTWLEFCMGLRLVQTDPKRRLCQAVRIAEGSKRPAAGSLARSARPCAVRHRQLQLSGDLSVGRDMLR